MRAIVLSGHTMGLGVARALGMMGIPVVLFHHDKRDMAHKSKYVARSIRTVSPEHDEQGFIEELLAYGAREGGGILMPSSDESTVALAHHKESLAEHFTVACPDWSVVKRFIEKKHTYALASELGIPAPRTYSPTSCEEIREYARQLDMPCLVKPSQSHLFYTRFKRKMFPVDTVDELLEVYDKAANAGLEVMVQEYIPGDDCQGVNYNSYFWEGRSIVEFTARKVRNAPPYYGSPRVVISEQVPEIIAPGRKLLEAVGYSGFACTEFKKDTRDGIYKLMEVNPRHNLSTMLAVSCGINFPWIEYQHLVHGAFPTEADFQTNKYWIDITRDIGYGVRYLRQEKFSFKDYVRPYIGRHVFAILDWKDPKPFLARCTQLLGQGVHSVLGGNGDSVTDEKGLS